MNEKKSYQSFAAQAGGSDSGAKLKALALPKRFDGMTILDVGCNEGFFSLEAKARGASRVVGIDRRENFVEAARRRAAEAGQHIEFEVRDAMDLPPGRFDYVFLFSTLHYFSDPGAVLGRIHDALAPGGKLILECGVLHRPGRMLHRAIRSIDDSYFPTLEMLRGVWLQDFAVRFIGPSVEQSGDPTMRFVFHCTRRKTNVCLVLGPGGAGKTVLAADISSAVHISADQLLDPPRWEKTPSKINPAQQRFDVLRDKCEGNKGMAWGMMKGDGEAIAYFAELIVKGIRLCRGARLVIVEGAILDDLQVEVARRLGEDFRCWTVARTVDQDAEPPLLA